MSDKRFCGTLGPRFWTKRVSEQDWHFCKHCGHDVPSFVLSEGAEGVEAPLSRIRCCWECGSSLAPLDLLDGAH